MKEEYYKILHLLFNLRNALLSPSIAFVVYIAFSDFLRKLEVKCHIFEGATPVCFFINELK